MIVFPAIGIMFVGIPLGKSPVTLTVHVSIGAPFSIEEILIESLGSVEVTVGGEMMLITPKEKASLVVAMSALSTIITELFDVSQMGHG
jgi:hypothetical protein